MPKKSKLNDKQQLFVKEYLISRNATDAYRRVYKVGDKVAEAAGPRLLGNVRVSEAIDQATIKVHKKLDISAERVIEELTHLSTFNLADAFKPDGSLKLISEMPESLQRALSGVDSEELWEGHGQDRVFIGDLRKFKVFDKVRSLELLARHFKLLTDVVEIKDSHKLAERLGNARKRKNNK